MVTRVTQLAATETTGVKQVLPQRVATGGNAERILYVVSRFPSLSETFIVREIQALLGRGADVRIVALRRGSDAFVQSDAAHLLDRVLYPPAPLRNLDRVLRRLFTQPLATIEQPLLIVRRLWRKPYVMGKSLMGWFRTLGMLDDIESWSPHHVHAHWATYPSTAALIISRYTRCPFSFTAHAHDIFLDDQLMQEKLESVAFVAVISRFNREYLRRRYRVANTRIEVVHCGVPRYARRPHEKNDRSEPLLVSVGRLDEVKGFPTLLRACDELKQQGVRFRCEIVGTGPLRRTLEATIASLGLQECVTLLGAMPSQDVEALLARADVFVLASQRSRQGNMDGIPVALMEAMASGAPVVSTAVSGIPELVEDGASGLLVPPRDPVALAHAVRRMLEDETLRTRCVANAARKVRDEFDAETEGARIHGIIRSIRGESYAETVADNN